MFWQQSLLYKVILLSSNPLTYYLSNLVSIKGIRKGVGGDLPRAKRAPKAWKMEKSNNEENQQNKWILKWKKWQLMFCWSLLMPCSLRGSYNGLERGERGLPGPCRDKQSPKSIKMGTTTRVKKKQQIKSSAKNLLIFCNALWPQGVKKRDWKGNMGSNRNKQGLKVRKITKTLKMRKRVKETKTYFFVDHL